ncbi:hypothetical protein F2Q70_00017636 [Brassica cretica]|uniref:Uncharacterized protein n=1 Tax=Brassica cretica TaxID=69181 RepID=A0A8S9HT00_BRACR|nr:hypothetical protein F2Q70_00017636 [Brassica cretica]KAF2596406.1 hypothetical protein F2Q68_00010567 [Brassica cretica]
MSGHVDTVIPSAFTIGRYWYLPRFRFPESLAEVPVGEQASLEGRDSSGDAAFGNSHLLLIEAGYVAS